MVINLGTRVMINLKRNSKQPSERNHAKSLPSRATTGNFSKLRL